MKTVIMSAAVSKEQVEALKKIQERTGLSRSNLIRQAINLVMGVYRNGNKKV